MESLRERHFAREKLRNGSRRARRGDVGLQAGEAAGDHADVTSADGAGTCSADTDSGDHQQRDEQNAEAHDGLLSPL
jgi:hypothetical protein